MFASATQCYVKYNNDSGLLRAKFSSIAQVVTSGMAEGSMGLAFISVTVSSVFLDPHALVNF